MSFDEERDPKLEPSLKEMTDVAIRVLSKNKKRLHTHGRGRSH